ncbi:WD repeat, SAM and U-box domain-containing protein 1 [Parasteatoda tepidariorum]|uniref:WD repeat, SAM and U-box domain-containing protein 1 n=1 Tax=Parasteatoda tepidariorum TaxID=114398 RepID=UPI001C7276B7|nr:WD repeat, SAM and U-box domain-containing protein 1 isoform X2 [Parasteatoda tepidariorum]XP_042899842.1 WD repeat, SAM and U-box domain-containing protein 1 isoform X2 [Parasteatoda tepidariorum]
MLAIEKSQTLEGHASDVVSCDFYKDYLATGSGDKTVKVWFRESKVTFKEAEFSPLLKHTYGVNCVRFSPVGFLLASSSTDGKTILWSVQDGSYLGEMQHPSGSPIRICSFSPNSSILATGGDDEKVILWDITTKSIIRILEEHEAMVTAVAFTPDCAFLVSCSTAGDIILWDSRYGHGKCLTTVANAHDLGILSCDFSPQYETVSESGFLSGNYMMASCGNDDLVKIWSVETNSTQNICLITTLEGHSGNVMSCRFSPDGTLLASTGGDRLIILWDPKTGQALQKLEGHTRYVTCCAFLNSSILATGSNDKTIAIWYMNKETISNPNTENTSDSSNEYIVVGQKRSFLSWSLDDVANWLKSLKLEELIESFQTHSIDGKELMYLNHENLLTVMKVESLGKRNKILRAIQCLKNPLWQHVLSDTDETLMLSEFCCPITQEVMRSPVVAEDGYSYERAAIEEWFESGKNTSPMTNEVLPNKLLIPNHVLLQLIQKYKL